MNDIKKRTQRSGYLCDLFITPAIKDADWNPYRQIRREVTLTPGPIVVRGNISSRNKKKKKFADYVLSWEWGVPVAVVEAKDNNHGVNGTLAQPTLNVAMIKNALTPLPPMDEQHRMVFKINELMNVCGLIKAQMNDIQIIQLQLADAIVEKVVA